MKSTADDADLVFSSKFFCGTEEGDLLYVDWVADKKEQKGLLLKKSG